MGNERTKKTNNEMWKFRGKKNPWGMIVGSPLWDGEKTIIAWSILGQPRCFRQLKLHHTRDMPYVHDITPGIILLYHLYDTKDVFYT